MAHGIAQDGILGQPNVNVDSRGDASQGACLAGFTHEVDYTLSPGWQEGLLLAIK